MTMGGRKSSRAFTWPAFSRLLGLSLVGCYTISGVLGGTTNQLTAAPMYDETVTVTVSPPRSTTTTTTTTKSEGKDEWTTASLHDETVTVTVSPPRSTSTTTTTASDSEDKLISQG